MASLKQTTMTVAAMLGAFSAVSGATDRYELAFEDFMAKYGRSYKSKQEESTRFATFKAHCLFIEGENTKDHAYKLAVNEFSDQSTDEFRSQRLGLRLPPAGKVWRGVPHLGTDAYSGAPLPAAVDWSSRGAVTLPKNQKSCGSCWAFSTTGALEGAWQIATEKLVSLSEQQLVDCSTENDGCDGGSMDLAFEFFEHQPVCTEDTYPYEGRDGTCPTSAACTVGIPRGAVVGFKDVPEDDEQALMEAVAQQPVSVAIEADQDAFQFYQHGILTRACGNKLDHGVLVVGYGTENGIPYWKVKNSWGPAWGEDGFIRLERGGVSKGGECGIKSQPSYPVVQLPAPGPAPEPTPAPPSPPSPGCIDLEDFCKDPTLFDPENECQIGLASTCPQECGCCVPTPPPMCIGAARPPSAKVPTFVV